MSETTAPLWRPGDAGFPRGSGGGIPDSKLFETIERSIDALSDDLRAVSLDISGETVLLVIDAV